MPSSDPMTIPYALELIKALRPKRLLDVGCGNGMYGFLFRECLDMRWGRMKPETWEAKIDGVEVVSDYRNPIHGHFYDRVFWEDWLKIKLDQEYDVAFMGDVLEHFAEGNWQIALKKAMDTAHVVVVVCPNWEGSMAQKAPYGHASETHRVLLSPAKVGGKCVWANTKAFMTVHSDANLEIGRSVIL